MVPEYVFAEQIKDGILTETEFMSMIRNEEWKLVHFLHMQCGQLFNLKDDPNEIRNLWDDSSCTNIKKKLLNQLLEWHIESWFTPMTGQQILDDKLTMKNNIKIYSIFVFCFIFGYFVHATDYPNTGSVERLSPAINDLISKNAKIEILAEGYVWSEGPVWVENGEFLLYSDVPTNKVYKWKEGMGASVFLDPSGFTAKSHRSGESGSNGITLDSQGRLVLCQHGDRRVARMKASTQNPKSEFVTLAANYQGAKFNSPNDLVYNQRGELYFTDPPYGLIKKKRSE